MRKYKGEFKWKAAAVTVAVAVGVPVMNVIYDFIPFPIAAAIVLLSAAALIITLYDRKRINNAAAAKPETCSDIKSIDFNLGAGNFVIRSADSFELETAQAVSRISGGVWYIESGIKHNNTNGAVSIIGIPRDFTAENAVIRLFNGNILIEHLAAFNTKLDVRSGSAQAKSIYARNLNAYCGSGSIEMTASIHGNANIECGSGKITLGLNNAKDDFHIIASSGQGKVTVGEHEIVGFQSRLDLNENAPFQMNIRCGYGETAVNFK